MPVVRRIKVCLSAEAQCAKRGSRRCPHRRRPQQRPECSCSCDAVLRTRAWPAHPFPSPPSRSHASRPRHGGPTAAKPALPELRSLAWRQINGISPCQPRSRSRKSCVPQLEPRLVQRAAYANQKRKGRGGVSNFHFRSISPHFARQVGTNAFRAVGPPTNRNAFAHLPCSADVVRDVGLSLHDSIVKIGKGVPNPHSIQPLPRNEPSRVFDAFHGSDRRLALTDS